MQLYYSTSRNCDLFVVCGKPQQKEQYTAAQVSTTRTCKGIFLFDSYTYYTDVHAIIIIPFNKGRH